MSAVIEREGAASAAPVLIVHMPEEFEPQVRALYRECHPTWRRDLPKSHFWAYPTIVALIDGRVAGYESCSMNVSDAGDRSMILQDIGVAEWARGRGIARALHAARFRMARELGARFVVGMTQPDNAAMLHVFRTEGFDEVCTIPTAYDDGKGGVLFILNLHRVAPPGRRWWDGFDFSVLIDGMDGEGDAPASSRSNG